MRALVHSMRSVLPLLLVLSACDDGSPVQSPDGGQLDTVLAPDTLRGPWANVYTHNPVVSSKQTTEVLLENISDAKGHLNGKYAEVWNCVPEPGGAPLSFGYVTGTWCVPGQRAEPGADGSYLEIKPPQSDVAGNDSFAEVMMYHHIDTVRRHYSESFGLTHLDKQALYAIVNLQANVGGQWMGFPNAGFSPKETPGFLGMLGLSQQRDAIVFGFNSGGMLGQGLPLVNLSYDAAVIYHEYTHYTIGGQVLHALAAPDKYGLSPTPMAFNEALADYFPSSFLEDPDLGSYALADHSRNLTDDMRCPRDFRGESHHDGRIASGALWAARKLLGPDLLDQAVWNAVLTFTIDTSFEEAAVAILDEVKQVAPNKHDAVKQIFEERGFMNCVRLMEHKDFTANPFDPTTAVGYPGPSATNTAFADGLPAYVQYRVAVLDTTQEVTIEYRPELLTAYGSKGDVWVALKPGSAPVLYNYSSTVAEHDAHVVLKGEDTGNNFKLVLSGDCVAKGDLVFLFINRGQEGQLAHVKLTQSATKTRTTDNFTGCTSP